MAEVHQQPTESSYDASKSAGTSVATSKAVQKPTLLARYTAVVQRLRGEDQEKPQEPSLMQKCFAEAFGTGVIVLTGTGTVAAATFTGAQQGLWQVAVVWLFGVTLAIYTTASVSGAHLNPAVSFAFAILRPDEFHPRLLPFYILFQVIGGVVASLLMYSMYYEAIERFETKNSIIRGNPESVLSATAFGEYFPNPGFHYASTSTDSSEFTELVQNPALEWDQGVVTPALAFYIEALGTAFLMLVILSVTDSRNKALKNKDLAPFFIGVAVAVLISFQAPLTQSGYNPARDFGPRFAAYMLGWGEVAIPGPEGGFWVYILGPMVGAPLGGAVYDFLLRPPA